MPAWPPSNDIRGTMPDTPDLIRFPALAAMPDHLAREVMGRLLPLSVTAGTTLFDVGMTCQGLPLILEGRIKVSKRAENGREIRLYNVHPGELCIVTVGCLLGGRPTPPRAPPKPPSKPGPCHARCSCVY
jgi:CRP/FNR family transcriptional regulator